MSDIPFNISTHFGEDLRDYPDDPEEMARAVSYLQEQLRHKGLEAGERAKLLGTLGVLCRTLMRLPESVGYLEEAAALCARLENGRGEVANLLRLAHAYQWLRDFGRSDSIFAEVLARCEREAGLADYVDFAYQHYGKSLFDQDRHEEALAMFSRALALRLEKGDEELVASSRLAVESTQKLLGVRAG